MRTPSVLVAGALIFACRPEPLPAESPKTQPSGAVSPTEIIVTSTSRADAGEPHAKRPATKSAQRLLRDSKDGSIIGPAPAISPAPAAGSATAPAADKTTDAESADKAAAPTEAKRAQP